ncbi:MAG: S1C family serine protease [Hespellia sp.]|nr:S1C family serine protease [Hespellia sp.]
MENNQDPKNGMNEESEDFSYLKETIKKESKTRMITKKVARVAVYGLIAGVFACLGFYALKPWALEHIDSDGERIIIESDESAAADPEEESTDTAQQIQVLDSANYKELMSQMYQVAKNANKSVVAVTAAKKTVKDVEQELDAKDPTNSVSGVIVTITDQEVLVLTASSITKTGTSWNVAFADNSSYPAVLKSQDENIGLAVMSVSRSVLSGTTMEEIKAASLGNSNQVHQGDSVIALGNPFGYADGMGYGVVSTAEYDKMMDDGEYGVLGTDIAAVEDGTGALFNFSGDLIGIIMPGVWDNVEGTVSNALSLSDLKPTIELLVNGESVPYVGIRGTTISDKIAEEQNLPKGVYVGEAAADSPAMTAGIQSGDIITSIGKKDITTFEAYQGEVLDLKVGEEVKIEGLRRGSSGYVDIEFTVVVGSKE